jgi:hypothetical protein
MKKDIYPNCHRIKIEMIDGTQRKIIDCPIALRYGWVSFVSLDKDFELTLK